MPSRHCSSVARGIHLVAVFHFYFIHNCPGHCGLLINSPVYSIYSQCQRTQSPIPSNKSFYFGAFSLSIAFKCLCVAEDFWTYVVNYLLHVIYIKITKMSKFNNVNHMVDIFYTRTCFSFCSRKVLNWYLTQNLTGLIPKSPMNMHSYCLSSFVSSVLDTVVLWVK